MTQDPTTNRPAERPAKPPARHLRQVASHAANAAQIRLPSRRGRTQCGRRAVPGGVAYFFVKQGDLEGIESDGRYSGDPKSVSYFTSSEMQTALTDAGFRVIDLEDMHRKLDNFRTTDRLLRRGRVALAGTKDI